MDLLDRIREEVGDEAQADRLGPFEPGGGEASSLLLAGVPTPTGPEGRWLNRPQRILEIGNQVVRVLDADRDPNEIGRNSQLRLPLVRD